MELAEVVYQYTLDAKGYKDLMSNTATIGIWDDHDYGTNNGDSTFKLKDRNRKLYLDFIGEAAESERRLQIGTAIHQDYIVTAH